MKAIILRGVGEPFELSEVEKPIPQSSEALIQLRAAALNHRDLWIHKGQYAGLKFPMIPGSDGAGIVESVGNSENIHWIGKEVIMNPGLNWGNNHSFQSKQFTILGMPENGTFAEYVTIPVENLYEKPAHLTFEQAAALPLAGVTAWRTLMTRAQVQSGEKCLVTGAGGGVAQFAIQFAIQSGAKVWVTSGSNKKIEKAISLGAEDGVNYRETDWFKQLKASAGNFQVIIDSAGGDSFGNLVKLADSGARIVFYGGTQGKFPPRSPQLIFWKQFSLLGSTMGSPKDFSSMIEFINASKLIPVVDQIFELSDIYLAVNKMEKAAQFGKIVIKVTENSFL